MKDKDILYKFFSNRANIDEQARVLDWLDESPENMKEMIAGRKIFDAVTVVADEKLLHRKQSPLISRRLTQELIRYAAAIIIMVGLGLYYQSTIEQKLLLANNTISVPAGQRVDIVLPDGTKVCMNALSKLEYPAFFMGKSRKVKLSGEAFFDVTHDAKHPFIVETYACNVEVLGTKFNVQAHQITNEFITSLVEGKVKVTENGDKANEVTLCPNQQVSYENNRLIVSEIPAQEGFLWREGLISFRNASFVDLIAKFEKYYGVNIKLQSKSISQSMFTGKIRISEGVDHAMWVLQQSAAFKYYRDNTQNIIYIR